MSMGFIHYDLNQDRYGFMILSHGEQLVWHMLWTTITLVLFSIDFILVSVSVCAVPTLNAPTMKLRDPQPPNPIYSFASVLVIQCQSGKYINYESYLDQIKDTFEIVCGYAGQWLPDPTKDLTCGRKSTYNNTSLTVVCICFKSMQCALFSPFRECKSIQTLAAILLVSHRNVNVMNKLLEAKSGKLY